MMIAQDQIDGRAVALDAIGPPVVTQKRAILVDKVAEPRQHDAHVVERHSLHILFLHAVLGSAEGAVDRLHEIRIVKSRPTVTPSEVRRMPLNQFGVYTDQCPGITPNDSISLCLAIAALPSSFPATVPLVLFPDDVGLPGVEFFTQLCEI